MPPPLMVSGRTMMVPWLAAYQMVAQMSSNSMEPEKFIASHSFLQVIIKNRRMRGPDGVEVEAASE